MAFKCIDCQSFEGLNHKYILYVESDEYWRKIYVRTQLNPLCRSLPLIAVSRGEFLLNVNTILLINCCPLVKFFRFDSFIVLLRK